MTIANGVTAGAFAIDTRDALRALVSRPGSAAASVALAIVAVAAITTAVATTYGIVGRPLAFPDADRLAVIWQVRDGEKTQISYPDFRDVTAAAMFAGAAAISGGRGSLRIADRIERINLLSIEASGFALLGASPHLGRLLTAADADTAFAMISHHLWTTHLNADPGVVGRVIWLSGREYTVVGVLRPAFDFELPVPPSFRLGDNDVWTVLERSSPFMDRRDVAAYEGLVKLSDGHSLAEAQAVLDTTAAVLERQHAATNTGRRFHIVPLAEEIVAPVRRQLLLVTLGAIVALLVAVANLLIVNLLRQSRREVEWSVREALGATAFRLRRQLVLEHALIATCGGVAGLALAQWLVHWLISNEAAHLPRADAVRFDAPVLASALGVVVLITLTLALQPIRRRPVVLRSGERTIGPATRRSRRAIVATEIALAITLTTAGTLLALSLARLLSTDIGFDPSAAVAARISAYEAEYRNRDDVVRFFDDVVARLRRLPDVAFAGASSSLPLSGQFVGTSVVAEGRPVLPGERPTAGWQFVTPGFVAASGLRLRAGRDFTESDRGHARHVTIVNESLARALFPGQDPVGRRIGVGGDDARGDWHEIIGVVADVKHQSLDVPPAPRVYDSFGQHWGRTLYVAARSRSADVGALSMRLRTEVAAVNADVPLFESSTLQTLVERSAAPRRLAATVAVGLAGAGLLLALIGVYAVTAASVAERTREIGVRAALGAAPRHLLQLIAGEGSRPAVWGAIGGALVSAAVARLLTPHLFEVGLQDAIGPP